MTVTEPFVGPTARVLSPVTSPDDPAWHAIRKQGVGASEIAAVLGISPWDSALGVWLAKTGRVERDEESEPMLWGKVLEGPIAEEYGRRNNLAVLPSPGVLQHREIPWALCSPDRMLAEPGDPQPFSVVEVKNVSAWKADGWDADEGKMPPHYLAQVIWQLGVTGYDEAAVACLVGGQHFESLTVHSDRALFERMVERASEFWDMVQSDTEPPYDHTLLSAEALRDVTAVSGKVVTLDRDLAFDLRARLAEKKAAKSLADKAAKEAEAAMRLVEGEVRALMLDAEVAVVDDVPVFTAKTTEVSETVRAGYTFRQVRLPKL